MYSRSCIRRCLVGVSVGVLVGVLVGVFVGVLVGVSVGVLVGVGVGGSTCSRTRVAQASRVAVWEFTGACRPVSAVTSVDCTHTGCRSGPPLTNTASTPILGREVNHLGVAGSRTVMVTVSVPSLNVPLAIVSTFNSVVPGTSWARSCYSE